MVFEKPIATSHLIVITVIIIIIFLIITIIFFLIVITVKVHYRYPNDNIQRSSSWAINYYHQGGRCVVCCAGEAKVELGGGGFCLVGRPKVMLVTMLMMAVLAMNLLTMTRVTMIMLTMTMVTVRFGKNLI